MPRVFVEALNHFFEPFVSKEQSLLSEGCVGGQTEAFTAYASLKAFSDIGQKASSQYFLIDLWVLDRMVYNYLGDNK